MRSNIVRRLTGLRPFHAATTSWQAWVLKAQEVKLPATFACPSALGGTLLQLQGSRGFAADANNYSLEVDEINTLFVEAREEIAYAAEDSETVYFDESVAEAKTLVDKCVGRWGALLDKMPDAERSRMQRSMGLKIEQLKAEYAELAATHS